MTKCDNCGKELCDPCMEVTWKSGTKAYYHVECYDETAQEYART